MNGEGLDNRRVRVRRQRSRILKKSECERSEILPTNIDFEQSISYITHDNVENQVNQTDMIFSPIKYNENGNTFKTDCVISTPADVDDTTPEEPKRVVIINPDINKGSTDSSKIRGRVRRRRSSRGIVSADKEVKESQEKVVEVINEIQEAECAELGDISAIGVSHIECDNNINEGSSLLKSPTRRRRRRHHREKENETSLIDINELIEITALDDQKQPIENDIPIIQPPDESHVQVFTKKRRYSLNNAVIDEPSIQPNIEAQCDGPNVAPEPRLTVEELVAANVRRSKTYKVVRQERTLSTIKDFKLLRGDKVLMVGKTKGVIDKNVYIMIGEEVHLSSKDHDFILHVNTSSQYYELHRDKHKTIVLKCNGISKPVYYNRVFDVNVLRENGKLLNLKSMLPHVRDDGKYVLRFGPTFVRDSIRNMILEDSKGRRLVIVKRVNEYELEIDVSISAKIPYYNIFAIGIASWICNR